MRGEMLPDKANATGILFKLWIIEPLLDRDGFCPGRVLHWFILGGLRCEDLISLVAHNQVGGAMCLCWECCEDGGGDRGRRRNYKCGARSLKLRRFRTAAFTRSAFRFLLTNGSRGGMQKRGCQKEVDEWRRNQKKNNRGGWIVKLNIVDAPCFSQGQKHLPEITVTKICAVSGAEVDRTANHFVLLSDANFTLAMTRRYFVRVRRLQLISPGQLQFTHHVVNCQCYRCSRRGGEYPESSRGLRSREVMRGWDPSLGLCLLSERVGAGCDCLCVGLGAMSRAY